MVWPTAQDGTERVTAGLCEQCLKGREAPEGPAETSRDRRSRLPAALRTIGVNVESHGHCRLFNFDKEPDGHALLDAKRLAAAWSAGDRRNWYLYSVRDRMPIAPGAGKTHLVVGLWAELYVAGEVAPTGTVFVRETRMAATLRRLIKDGSPEEYLDRLIKAELLILDDVGKVQSDSPWIRELMFELYAGREGKPTWITSNYGLAKLEERDEVYLAIGSRIAAGALITELSGPDRRLNPHPARRGTS